MAVVKNYHTSYVGTSPGRVESYLGTATVDVLKNYVSGFLKNYVKDYTGAQYEAAYVKAYSGQFNKN